MNEQIAAIERENRAFWSRLLRERFDRDVTLKIDWDTFEIDSAESGWPLYPLNIQQAGVERLLYAVTGLMDKDEKFRTAAIDSIDSIHISSAKDLRAVKLLFHKGRITYHCFAGDWNGYFGIEQMQQYLDDSVPRKSKVRRKVEEWIREFLATRAKKAKVKREAASASEAVPEREPAEYEPGPVVDDRPTQEQSVKRTIPEYDADLRTELESIYSTFLRALAESDLETLLSLVEITKTDEETLRNEMQKDGFSSFSKWLLTTYPSQEKANFISLKTEENDVAGYYVEWLPPYTRDYLVITLIRYLKIDGQWKIVLRLAEMASAAFQVRKDEDTLTKALEEVETNPLLALERPELCEVLEKPAPKPKLTEKEARLREELEKVIATVYRSLEQNDVEQFLSAVAVSQLDGKKLRKKFKRLSKEILENTPDPSQATFVALKGKERKATGYYFVAPFPKNPAFRFVYLRPFVQRDAQWKMLFSLDHDLAVSLNIAKSGGDIVSRAEELITEIDLLHLEWVMTALFEDIIGDTGS